MSISSRLDELHVRVRSNKWFKYFALFNRLALAAGFIPSGLVKIMGERFTALTSVHPMGHFLFAFYQTGWYYTFVGVMQVTAAVLLLIPRTATLGAFIYFPIILNICILSLSVRFDGSLLTAPLMVLANLYLLCWDYHKWKLILPFNHHQAQAALPTSDRPSNRFPIAFFGGVFATVLIVGFTLLNIFDTMPRNSVPECQTQCEESENPQACHEFCDCIHVEGKSLEECLDEYHRALRDPAFAP